MEMNELVNEFLKLESNSQMKAASYAVLISMGVDVDSMLKKDSTDELTEIVGLLQGAALNDHRIAGQCSMAVEYINKFLQRQSSSCMAAM